MDDDRRAACLDKKIQELEGEIERKEKEKRGERREGEGEELLIVDKLSVFLLYTLSMYFATTTN